MTLAYTIGSPAAIVAALGVTVLAILAFGRGSLVAFGYQRDKIDELLQKIADLEKDAVSKDTRIVELERVVSATQLLPVAGFTPVLDSFAAHELRAAERHVELQEEHTKLMKVADAQLRILGDIASHMPGDTTGA